MRKNYDPELKLHLRGATMTETGGSKKLYLKVFKL